jgi:hypothetical protein
METRQRHSLRTATGVFGIGLAALLPVAAHAQAGPDDWKFGATIYGWFPAIGGSTSFPTPGGGPSIDVSSRQVIDALKFTFMGSLEARKGQWGAWTDLVYADFGASKSGTRDFTVGHEQVPVGVDASLNLDVKSWIWTLAGTYSLASKPEGTADLLAGARLLDLEQTLGWSINGSIPGQPGLVRNGSATVTVSDWNAIVGVKGRANLGADGKWFVPYYVDVGGGQSKLTWQAIAGVGYQFGWGAVLATWRYLDYDFKSGSKVESLNFNGAAIGVSFAW